MKSQGLLSQKLHKYGEIFKEENLSFHKPKRDAYNFCVRHENLTDPSPTDQVEYRQHIIRKCVARSHKEYGKNEAISDPNVHCVCFDVEQVLPTPCLTQAVMLQLDRF